MSAVTTGSAAAALALTAGLGLTACSSSSTSSSSAPASTSASASAAATTSAGAASATSCGTIPTTLPSDPDGVIAAWAKIREAIGPDSNVSHTRIEWLLVPDPWFRGRIIVIGDAAHACPPLIAQGAAMCTEDAVVLAELVTGDLPLEAALPAFMARRMDRVDLVVRNSMRLVRWEMGLEPHTEEDVARTMNSTLGFLAAAEA